MPFNTGMVYSVYGMDFISFSPTNRYCQNDKSKPDYGKCYGTDIVKLARFVLTDTDNYPVGSLPCERDKTCVRYTSTENQRTLETTFHYIGRQAIVYRMVLRSHTSLPGVSDPSPLRIVGVGVYNAVPDFEYTFVSGVHTYEPITYPYYDPVFNYKIYYNPYKIPIGNVVVIRWTGYVFTTVLYFGVHEFWSDNIWYAVIGQVYWFYESSPLAIIPLHYEHEYVPHRELRNAFGYAANGVDQPGWNVDDMIHVLKELFPDRAWAVFDDKTYTLYLYNLTLEFVPDWLIDRLAPTEIKIIKRPSDPSVAKMWLDELNRRNGYIQPSSELA